jgi:hypothetical protein
VSGSVSSTEPVSRETVDVSAPLAALSLRPAAAAARRADESKFTSLPLSAGASGEGKGADTDDDPGATNGEAAEDGAAAEAASEAVSEVASAVETWEAVGEGASDSGTTKVIEF